MALATRFGSCLLKRSIALNFANKRRTFMTTTILNLRRGDEITHNAPECTDEVTTMKFSSPECPICPDIIPRYDDLYYKVSDKAKRVYTQTWAECPEKRVVPKKLCDYDKIIYPKLEKRPRKARPKTAGSAECGDANLMKCLTKPAAKCARITLPGCKAVRNPATCKFSRIPSDCRKICTPYPSYSECKKDPRRPKRADECHCLEGVSMCEILNEIKKQAGNK